MKERIEKAVFHFRKPFNEDKRINCAQAIALTYADLIGLTEKQAISLTAGFGRGMGKGQTCGAVTVMLMVVGLSENGEKCHEMIHVFEEKMGSTLCDELLEKYTREYCPHLVQLAAKLINREIFDK